MSNPANTVAPSAPDENKNNTGSIILKFLREYKNKPAGESGKDWMSRQFAQYPGLWNNAEEREKDAADIVDEIERIMAAKAELKQHLAEGKSPQLYLYTKAQECVKKNGGDPGRILHEFNRALGQANESLTECAAEEDDARLFEQKPVEVLREDVDIPRNEDDLVELANEIVDKTSASGILKTVYHGARIFGGRGVNWVLGKDNPPLEDDLRKFVDEAVKAGGIGLAIPVTGGVTVAAKNGNLGKQLMKAPVTWITDSVWSGLENTGNMWKVGEGLLDVDAAIEEAGNTACAMAGEMIQKGSTGFGAWVGSVFGPTGAAIGAKVGSFLGRIVGNPVAKAIGNGVKKVGHWVKEGVTKVVKGAWNGVKSVCRSIASWFGL